MPTVNDALAWRYATKKFDASKTVSDADIETLKRSVNLTATSFGLQPFRTLVVSDRELKKKLREASYDQTQVEDSSHVFIFAAKTDMDDAYIEEFGRRMAAERGIDYAEIEGYVQYMQNSVGGMELKQKQDWMKRQAYIALGSLMAQAAELRIDNAPMEGFVPAKFDALLGLTDRGLTATVMCCVGYRSEEDGLQHAAKVRLPLERMFVEVG